MAASRTLKRSYTSMQLNANVDSATTGVWTMALSAAGTPAGTYTLHKAAAATTSVLHFPVPPSPFGGNNDDAQLSIIEFFYLVTTADLTSAPTAVLNKMTYPGGAGTGLAALAAVTQVLSFAGIDTIGKVSGAGAAGSHIAVVTITTPSTAVDSDCFHLQMTMGEAATSVLDIFGITCTYKSY
jgi:hypothetical protein